VPSLRPGPARDAMALSATMTVMGGRPVARTALWALLSLSGVGAWMAPAAVPRLSPRARCVSARAASKNLPVRATAAAAAAGGSRPLRILCADKLDEAALESLRKKGHEVLSQPELSATTLEAALAELAPQLLVVRSTKVLAPALAAAPGLELVVRAGAGVDNIDLAAAASQGVSVANCAGANAAAVAELALGLMIACDRRIVEQDNRLKKGAWAKGVFGDVCMCVSVCVRACARVSVSLSLCLPVSLSLCVRLCLSACRSMSDRVCLSCRLAASLFPSLPLSPLSLPLAATSPVLSRCARAYAM